jgi:outer membrane scaffolding protein for murein synthesis (MipA/OmpV family)
MFAGPSFTFADRLHMQTLFGVSTDQSLASGYPDYLTHSGAESAGFGFGATRFLGRHWLLHLDLAANRLLGCAARSPITQRTSQNTGVLAAAYSW